MSSGWVDDSIEGWICVRVLRYWVAFDAPNNCLRGQVVTGGHKIFKTSENAILEGLHTWSTNYAAPGQPSEWRDTGLSCMTTCLW